MSDHSYEIKEIEKALNNICGDWVGIGIQMNDARQALLELKRLASIGAPTEEPEIVRCKDCQKRETCRTSTVWAVAPGDNWYCADGERRDDG